MHIPKTKGKITANALRRICAEAYVRNTNIMIRRLRARLATERGKRATCTWNLRARLFPIHRLRSADA
jgi:hypothetical protein